MNVLLEGTQGDVRAWAEEQIADFVSCRELLAGRSPRLAHAFTAAALRLVHRALAELPPLSEGSGKTYVWLSLHEAVASALASAWTFREDDARHIVALELAQRLRTTCAPFFGQAPTVFFDSNLMAVPRSLPSTRSSDPHNAERVLAYVAGLVDLDLAQEQGRSEFLGKLKRLKTGFGLTQRELATLLKVRPQAIRKWLAGGGASSEVRAAVDVHLAKLQRLESHFKTGMLPSILRRPDRGLKGRTPMTVVLADKADEFADYVERVIADGRTA